MSFGAIAAHLLVLHMKIKFSIWLSKNIFHYIANGTHASLYVSKGYLALPLNLNEDRFSRPCRLFVASFGVFRRHVFWRCFQPRDCTPREWQWPKSWCTIRYTICACRDEGWRLVNVSCNLKGWECWGICWLQNNIYLWRSKRKLVLPSKIHGEGPWLRPAQCVCRCQGWKDQAYSQQTVCKMRLKTHELQSRSRNTREKSPRHFQVQEIGATSCSCQLVCNVHLYTFWRGMWPLPLHLHVVGMVDCCFD